MQLSEIIAHRIKQDGPISFHDYMEMALYYPRMGYYTSPHDKIGASGDYYTSSDLGSLFGAMLAKQIEEMWGIMREKAFTIVEYGAGNGNLCNDILNYLKNNSKLYNKLNYCIIEKSPAMREKEKLNLKHNVTWYNSILEIPFITGCVLSNELIDNFAVHKVVMKDELMEVFVEDNNGFVELLRPASPEIKNYLEELQVQLPKDYCTEINLQALYWIKEVAASMRKGYIITIDYGHLSSELYNDTRHNGTLLCYNKHKINDQLYNNIGGQDITAHVNFTALHHWGLKNGLHTCGLTNQAQFLLSMEFNKYYANKEALTNYDLLQRNALLKYILLVDMGNIFKILIQSKGVQHRSLSGLKNAPYTLTN